MNLTLWIIAGLLAAVFLLAGANKLFIPQEKLAKAPGGGWVLDFSAGFVKACRSLRISGWRTRRLTRSRLGIPESSSTWMLLRTPAELGCSKPTTSCPGRGRRKGWLEVS